MMIQTPNLAQVAQPNENMRVKQVKIPRRGTQGTNGVLKGRGKSGCDLRSTITLAQTIEKAKSVPILVSWPTKDKGAKAAKIPTATIKTTFATHGV